MFWSVYGYHVGGSPSLTTGRELVGGAPGDVGLVGLVGRVRCNFQRRRTTTV